MSAPGWKLLSNARKWHFFGAGLAELQREAGVPQ